MRDGLPRDVTLSRNASIPWHRLFAMLPPNLMVTTCWLWPSWLSQSSICRLRVWKPQTLALLGERLLPLYSSLSELGRQRQPVSFPWICLLNHRECVCVSELTAFCEVACGTQRLPKASALRKELEEVEGYRDSSGWNSAWGSPAGRTTLVHGRGQAKQGEWERHSPSVGNQSLIQRKRISNCLPCSGN